MSKENLEQFMNQVVGSEELQARIGEEIEAEALIVLGAEHGYDFDFEDLQELVELSDEELDGVSGGMHQGAMNSVRPKGQYEPAGQVYFTPAGGGNENTAFGSVICDKAKVGQRILCRTSRV